MVPIGEHSITTRVIHSPKRTKTSLITEADLITESDEAVRAVHSSKSWFFFYLILEDQRLKFRKYLRFETESMLPL